MTDNDTDTETDDEQTGLSPMDAFEELAEASGQSYMTAENAWSCLKPFARYVTDQFVTEYDDKDADEIEQFDRGFALSQALDEAQQSTADARGFLNTWPHQQVLTTQDVTEILVKAVGEEPSDASYGGAGFTADARHDENIEILGDALELAVEA